MEDEKYKQLQEELNKYREVKDVENDKVLSVLTAGKAIGQKPIDFMITDDVSIKIKSFIPSKLKSNLIEVISDCEEDASGYDDIVKAYSEFLSEMCIDEELKDPRVWIEFDNESGSLIDLANAILKDLTASKDAIESFRRK